MSRLLPTLLALLFLPTTSIFAHGGQFKPPGGNPRTPTPPGLPAQPTAPAQTGKVLHTWTVWWGYTQFQYLDYRRLQRERRGPVTGSAGKQDANAWRDKLRARLIPVLRKAILDSDKEVRTAAAVALGKLQVREAIPDLVRMLEKDKLQEAREAALMGLMFMREPQLRATFEKEIRKKSGRLRVRGFALFGIGRLGDDRSIAYLQSFFDRKDKKAKAILPSSKGELRQFRVACLAAMLMGEREDLADFFLGVANNERFDEEVRAYAVTGLGKMGAREKLKDLLGYLKNARADDQIRRSAAVALGVIGKPTDAAVVDQLKKSMIAEKDQVLRHFATISLGRIGGAAAAQALLKRLKRVRNEDREFVFIALGISKDPRAAKPLAKALVSEANARRKAAAALALGLLGDRKQADVVRKEYVRAKDWLQLQTCSLALGMLNHKKSAPDLKDVLIKKKQPALRTAAALAYALIRQHAAVPVFLDILRSTNSLVTMTAMVRVMSYLSSPNAAKPLEELYANKKLQRQIRAYALVGLGALADRADFPLLVSMGFDINYFVRCPPLDEALTIL
ncbi:MAG: HEAT repeat domain-containing protein [Planctomycetota bacterium]|jgi:HEAT repeat protein